MFNGFDSVAAIVYNYIAKGDFVYIDALSNQLFMGIGQRRGWVPHRAGGGWGRVQAHFR